MHDLDNRVIMATNIKKYMEIHNIDRNTICDKLNIKYSTFSEWLNAKKYPRIDKIELLANYFNCKKSDLIEDSKYITEHYSKEEKDIIHKYKTLDTNGKTFVKSVLDREYERCTAQYETKKLIARGHEGDKPIDVKIRKDIKLVPSDEDL